MDSQSLATFSNLALYAAMGVLAVAMVGFVWLTAATVAGRRREAPSQARTPVGVGVGASGPQDRLPGEVAPEGRDRAPRAARVGGVATTLSWLGTLILGFSIVLRGASVQRPPVSNMFEFAVAGSFLVLAIYLITGLRRPLKWLGLFVVGPVLLVLGLAITVWYTEASELVPSLKSTWLVIHVPIAILSTAVFTVAFFFLLLHLAQERREARLAAGGDGARGGSDGFLSTIPDAASLDRTAYALNVAAFPLWTFTIIAGAIWGQQAWGTYWSWDPKEVWTFVIWVVYAAYLHARATSGWSLRTANVIAVVGYLAILANFTIVNMYFPGMHSYSGLVTP